MIIADGFGEDGRGGAAGDDGFEVVPAASDAAAVFVNEFPEGNGHFLFDGAGVVDVPGDAEEFGAGVAFATEAVEPVGAAAADGGGYSYGFYVCDCGRAAEKPDGGRERWLEARLSGLALERFDQGGFLPTDICAHSSVNEDVEIISASAGVLTYQAFFVGFLDRSLEDGGFVVELPSDVDVCCGGVHGSAGDETAFDEFVGIFAHDFPVFAGSGLTFIGVDDEIAGLGVFVPVFEVHE